MPGDVLHLAGHDINTGLFYAGQYLPSISGGKADASLIDPELSVTRPPTGHETLPVSGWPEYATMSPHDRGAYLQWLSEGRTNPHMDVGYVFLFFYGLERRLFMDMMHQPNTDEHRAILEEVQRLLQLYAHHQAFLKRAGQLLVMDWLLNGDRNIIPDSLRRLMSYIEQPGKIPELFQLALGRHIILHQPIPLQLASLASQFLAYGHLVTRKHDYYDLLFQQHHNQTFGDGILVERITKRLNYSYHFASPSIRGFVSIRQPLPCLPTKYTQQLLTMAKQCQQQLQPYYDYLRRDPHHTNHLYLLASLPDDLLLAHLHQDSSMEHTWLQNLSTYLDNLEQSPADLLEVYRCLEMHSTNPLPTKNDFEALAKLLHKLGYLLAPDNAWHAILNKLGYTKMADNSWHPATFSSNLFICHRAPMPPPPEPTQEFLNWRNTLLLLHESGLLAMITDRVQDFLGTLDELTAWEQLSLQSLWQYINLPDIILPKLPISWKKLTLEQREDIRQHLLDLTLHFVELNPSNLQQLARLYKKLQFPPEQVTTDIHNHLTDGHPINAPYTSTTKDFKLNKTLLLNKQLETAQVQQTLQDIFGTVESVVPVVETTAPPQLSSAQQEFLRQLATKNTWELTVVQQLAQQFHVLLDGTIEILNSWTFAVVDAPLMETVEQTMYVDQELAQRLLAELKLY